MSEQTYSNLQQASNDYENARLAVVLAEAATVEPVNYRELAARYEAAKSALAAAAANDALARRGA